METEPEQTGIIDQLFQLLQQLILPNWPDLIELLPWVIMAIVVGWLVFVAWQWRRAASINRSRVPRRLAGGTPPPGIHLPGPSRWPFVVPIGAGLLLFGIAVPPKDAAGNALAPVAILPFVLGLLITFIAIGGWLWDAMREWRATNEPHLADGHAAALTAGTSASMALVPAHGGAPMRPGAVAAAGYAEPTYKEPPPGVHMPGPSPWPFFAPIAMMVVLYGIIFSAVLLIAGLILCVIAMTGWYLEAGREYRSTEAVGHAVPATRDPYRAWPRRLVPVFFGVIGLAVLITLAPVAMGYLNSLTPAEATPTPVKVPQVPEVAANNAVSFDTRQLIVPADRPFDLVFNNNDAGVPHNVEIDDTPARATTIFDGEVVTGPTSVTYNVPTLTKGTYYFLCRIHPNMSGEVLAMPETGPPGGAPNGPSGAPGAPSGAPSGESAAPQASAP